MSHARCAPSPVCNIPYMSQGPIFHTPVVHHALCVTYPTCHRVRYVTSMLRTMSCVSHTLYVTGFDMSQALCVTYLICHRVRYVTNPACHIPYMSQGPICHKPCVSHTLYVTSPLYTMPCVSHTLFLLWPHFSPFCFSSLVVHWFTDTVPNSSLRYN